MGQKRKIRAVVTDEYFITKYKQKMILAYREADTSTKRAVGISSSPMSRSCCSSICTEKGGSFMEKERARFYRLCDEFGM
jgi:hypothetical protein